MAAWAGDETKRSAEEWQDAILTIIRQHGGRADHDDFYSEIPRLLHLNKRELRESTRLARYEPVWRGTLRAYLSYMVRDGILAKSESRKRPVFFRSQAKD